MKKLILTIIITAIAATAFAQEFEKFDTTHGTYEQVSKRGPYLTNKFWDNWFIGAGIGANVYMGRHDGEGSFGKRIAPAFDVSIGKWATPSLGIRAQASGSQARGWSTMETNYTHGSANADGLFKKKFTYMNYHVDVLWNISNSIGGFKESRTWNFVPFMGVGAVSSTKGDHNTRWEIAAVGGLLNNIRLGRLVDITLEAKVAVFNGHLDLDRYVAGTEHKRRLDAMTTVTAGVAFKIGNRKGGFKRPVATVDIPADYTPYNKRINDLEGELSAAAAKAAQLAKDLEAEKARKAVVKYVEGEARPVSGAVLFPLGSAKLNEAALVTLEYLSQGMKATPENKYTVIGSADSSTGTAAINEALSIKRTEAVAKALIEKFGVKESQFTTENRGGVSTNINPALDRSVIIE